MIILNLQVQAIELLEPFFSRSAELAAFVPTRSTLEEIFDVFLILGSVQGSLEGVEYYFHGLLDVVLDDVLGPFPAKGLLEVLS